MPDSNIPKEKDDESDGLEDIFQAYADAADKKDVAEMAAAALEAMQAIAEKPDDEPSPWRQLMAEARQYEEAARWQEAEETYQRAVELTVDDPRVQSHAFNHLAALYRLLGSDALAFEATKSANEAARHGDMPLLVSHASHDEAEQYLNVKDLVSAWVLIEKAFETMEEGPMYDVSRSRALSLRARYFIEKGAVNEATADLDAAWNLMEPWQEMVFMAGWQDALARWWTVTAQLRSSQGDKSGAIAARREVVHRRRIIAQAPHVEGPYKHNSLAVALRNLGRALRENNDPLASYSFKESLSIRRSIGLPPLDE